MSQAKLQSGQMINLGEDFTGDSNIYRVKILAVYKRVIELELPKEKGEKPDIIEVGKLLTLSFVVKAGLNILDVKVKEINEYRKRIVVVRESEIRRIQRRRYVRLSLKKEIKYQRIINLDDDFCTGTMLDISASGIGMKLKELNGVAMYQVLDIKLNNLSCGIDLIKGRVVRLNEKEDPDTGKIFYELGIEFFDINYEQRENLIEWILAKQREWRQAGLI